MRLGTASPDAVRIVYREEQPLVRTVEIVLGDGVRVTTSRPKPGSEHPAFADAWDRSIRTIRLSTEARRRLVSALPVRALAALPREEAVAPGASRFALTIDAGSAGRVEAQCSLETAARDPAITRWRGRLLRLAGR